MKDHRYVDELSIEELEAVLRLRRRQERLRRLGDNPAMLDPLETRGRPLSPQGRDQATPSPEAVLDDETQRFSARMDSPRRSRERRPVKWRWIRDQLLLFVEILAVFGLVWIVARMASTVSQINEESRSLQTMPTLTPTPMIGVFVLPGGHTPPDANQRSQPAPIPIHLRDLVAQVTPLPVPTPGPEHAQRITIPAIDVDAPVIEGNERHQEQFWEMLKKGAVHHMGSANPGERGNCVISAHNDIYGEIFRRLSDLTVGDEIVVQTLSNSYRYEVKQTRIVEPTEVSILDATSTPVLTLYSCYPYRVDTHRIVVIASLVTE